MDKLIEKYMEYLKYQKKYSEYTYINYEEDLMCFKEYLIKEHLDYLKIEYSDIRLFYNYLDERKFSKNTISRRVSAIRSFYRFLAKNGYISSNPFLLASPIKKDKLIPKFLYYNELEILFNTCDLSNFLGIRDRLLLELLYATGMRVGEIENVLLKDIDMEEQSIRIIGKGNKERIVFYGDYADEILRIYLSKRCDTCPYLLINKNKTRLTSRGIAKIINKIIDKSSLDTKISPHTLRHTFATHLLNEGCDILSIQELLGHESLKATQVYTHITSEELRNTYLKTHPRGHKKID